MWFQHSNVSDLKTLLTNERYRDRSRSNPWLVCREVIEAWRAALSAALTLVCQEEPGERLDHLDQAKPLIVLSPLDVNGCFVCVRMSHGRQAVTGFSLFYHRKRETAAPPAWLVKTVKLRFVHL